MRKNDYVVRIDCPMLRKHMLLVRTLAFLILTTCGGNTSDDGGASSDDGGADGKFEASGKDGGCEGGIASIQPGYTCGTCDKDVPNGPNCIDRKWVCDFGELTYCPCALAGASLAANCCDPCADGGPSVRWQCDPQTRHWVCPPGTTVCGMGACADGS